LRPRGGLLRAREFLMKDLYTFDSSPESALDTYQEVTVAYHNFFRELGPKFVVAKASSGAMGGNMSHEYHYPSPNGEDLLFCCIDPHCGFVANAEVLPQLSVSKETNDHRCPECKGTMETTNAIEVGHTFHLGTRYSAPLAAQVQTPTNGNQSTLKDLEMGCHGIGISRLIPAIASSATPPGSSKLVWPSAIAPFHAVIIGGLKKEDAAMQVYDHLQRAGHDIVLDDREHRDFAWKMKDADLIGYPIIVVVGRAWQDNGVQSVEVQWLEAGTRQKTFVTLEVLNETLARILKS
jgi:prolyl-tRNA synthetase